jgi:hypothetical protein
MVQGHKNITHYIQSPGRGPNQEALDISGVPMNFFQGGGGSTNSVEDSGQREQRSGVGSPLVKGSTQFANE